MRAIILIACICLVGCGGDPQAKCIDNVIYYKPYLGANYYIKGAKGCIPAPQPQDTKP